MLSDKELDDLSKKTIDDFGVQWSVYTENRGYYASTDHFEDIFSPLIDIKKIKGARVGDIGSGTGRVVAMLAHLGASEILALEPSQGYETLLKNTERFGSIVKPMRASGEKLPPGSDLDFVFSIGVIHHIPDPDPIIKAMYDGLRPGGTAAVWLYGKEGNELYLSLALPFRAISHILPHSILAGLCWALWFPLLAYIKLCKVLAFLPMSGYFVNVVDKCDSGVQRLIIYDQLNPAYAKYYTQDEAEQLLAKAGFINVRLFHRHGYSWSVAGDKPDTPQSQS